MLEDDAEIMSNTQLEELLDGQPEDVQAEIIRINTDARPIALQVALLVPLLAALLGLVTRSGWRKLPDPRPPATPAGRCSADPDAAGPARIGSASAGTEGTMATETTQASAAAAKAVLITLAAAQFVMILDSSVMNVSIATVAKDLDTTVTGIQTAITHVHAGDGVADDHRREDGRDPRPQARVHDRLRDLRVRFDDDGALAEPRRCCCSAGRSSKAWAPRS